MVMNDDDGERWCWMVMMNDDDDDDNDDDDDDDDDDDGEYSVSCWFIHSLSVRGKFAEVPQATIAYTNLE